MGRLRVLIIGRAKDLSAEAAMYRTLTRLGHTVALVDDRRLRQLVGRRAGSEYIRAKARAFRPDRIIAAKPHDVELDVLADICARTPAVMWYRDLTIPPDPELVARAPFFDVVFLTPGGQAPLWEQLGARRALFLPDCADPQYERPMPPVPEWICDVGFIGRGDQHGDTRAPFLVRLAQRFKVRVWGHGWESHAGSLRNDGETAYGEDFGRACSSARIVLGANIASQIEHQVHGYQSNRMVKVLAAKGFYLGHGTAGLRDLFRDGEHCAWYDDEAHAVELIERYLADDAGRNRIREQGHAFLLEHHTFENRLHNLLTGEPWVNPLTHGGPPARLARA